MGEDTFKIGDIEVKRGERGFTRLRVAKLLVGAELGIPVHVIHGAKPGPVLGMIGLIHGLEHFPVRIQREVVLGINPQELAGTVLSVPVANPVAFSRAKRSTPEDDIDFGDLNRIFPGRRAKPAFGQGESPASDRSLTEMIASTLAEQYIPRLQYMIDFHCHWHKGGLFMMLQDKDDGTETMRRSHDITRYFNLGIVNENNPAGIKTATGFAHSIGVATACVEVGGGLTEQVARKAVKIGADGVFNILRRLKMLPGEPVEPKKQFSAHVRPHVRPTKAGYLLTHCEPEDLFKEGQLGMPVKKGDVLAEVFDPYTFEVVEQVTSPVDGIVYMTRASGPVEAGYHGYSIADTAQARWIE
jgi:predicted deacylase